MNESIYIYIYFFFYTICEIHFSSIHNSIHNSEFFKMLHVISIYQYRNNNTQNR